MPNIGIIIQGTKDGFKTLYVSDDLSETDKMSIVCDIRSSHPSENAIGKQCYGISFAPNGKVFSIYRAMYDSPRHMAVGFLGISLFVPFELKEDGQKVLSLLDKLMDKYCTQYAPGNKLGAQNEEWSFIKELLDGSQICSGPSTKTKGLFTSGIQDVAYMYYNENSLVKYFENVFQSQYITYRQVLLMDVRFKESNSLLMAFKHSPDDLTSVIDIENPKYQLNINHSPGIEVRVNGNAYQHGAKFKRNLPIEIEFKKLFHVSSFISGTYHELLTKYDDICFNDGDSQYLNINPPSLIANSKSFKISVSDGSNLISKQDIISITCNTHNGRTKYLIDGDTIILEGNELGENWHIEVDCGWKYEKSFYTIYKEDNSGFVTIHLKEKRQGRTLAVTDENTSNDGKYLANGFIRTKPPKSRWQKHKMKVFGISGIIIIAAIISLMYNYLYPSKPFEGNVETNSISQDRFNSIESYSDGMELNLDTLNSFQNILNNHFSMESSSPGFKLLEKVDNAIKLRKVINQDDEKIINAAFVEIKGLSSEQNDLLKLIDKYDFNYFTSIKNRDKLSLSAIKYKLDSINYSNLVQEEQTDKQIADNSNGNLDNQSDNSGTLPVVKKVKTNKFSNEEFLLKIIGIQKSDDIDEIDKAKLTQEQRDLIDKISRKTRSYINMQNKEKYNFRELKKKINEL
jgi:hypothetical protein